MSIKIKLATILSASAIALFAAAATSFLSVKSQDGELFRVGTLAERTATRTFTLSLLLKDLRYDVIQVQQWLTDISATRGLDGLDDGFDEAEAAARAFQEDLAAASELAIELGHDELVLVLAKASEAFGPYYDVGREMAYAYIEYGPEGGNAQMSGFDDAAAGIAAEVERLAEISADLNARETEALLSGVSNVEREADLLLMISGLVAIVALLSALVTGASVWFFALRPMDRLKDAMAHLAEGDTEVEITGAGKNDEIGAMAHTVQVFRDGMLQKAALEAEQKSN
jgi:methyl-accepting chemotaxis protein